MAYRRQRKPKKVQTDEEKEEEIRRTKMPKRGEGEMFGVVTQRLGSNQIRILCEDGKERVCRIPGKMRKRVWMRPNDIVIIKPWEFQTGDEKADVVWRYTHIQAEHLRRKGILDKLNA